MKEKRILSHESELNPHQQPVKRIRPSFASVIGEVVTVNSLRNLCSVLEPVFRKVVNEEVDRSLRRYTRTFTRSSSLRIQALEPSTLKLIFCKSLSLPIFTGSRIVDADNNPLQLLLVDSSCDQKVSAPDLLQAIKLEVVVLDGDFPAGERETWTSDEFAKGIVKERPGKRPLLLGELNVTMRDGFATVEDIEFSDNSSWIRSRKFRIGVRVAAGANHQGVRICEAITEAFMVKDHRGELYKKHHPPMLNDEVWRLEKIGKDGAYHRKLKEEGINTVQDFLKFSTVDAARLRKILGGGMSERIWEITLQHAKECDIGNKLYIFRGQDFTLFLNPICQVVRAVINGQECPTRELSVLNRNIIENLARQAYCNWNSLEVVDGALNDGLMLTQGEILEQCPNPEQAMVRAEQASQCHQVDKSIEIGFGISYGQGECSHWDPTYIDATVQGGIHFTSGSSSSDGDFTSRTFFS